MMRLFTVLTILLAFTAQTAAAQVYQRPDDMEYIKQKEPLTQLQPDMGYIYLRLGKTSKKWVPAPTFIRQLTDAEMTAYEEVKAGKFKKAFEKNEKKRAKRMAAAEKAKAKGEPYTKTIPGVLTPERFVFEYEAVSNVYMVAARKEYRKTDYGRDMFFTLKPGNYVLYNMGGVCLCLGTVQFEVKPGEITDLGFIVADFMDRDGEVSPYAEIEETTKNHGIYRTGFPYVVSAVRPYKTEMEIPAELAGLKRVGAQYNAKGKMPMYFSTMLDRLPAIPGVLGYRGDKVVDERTGQVLE